MKRIFIIVFTALLVCVAACIGVYQWQMRTPPDEWLGRRLGLSGGSLEQFNEAHHRYAATCAQMCVKIRNSDAELAALVMGSREFTPEIAAAMARSDALRNECRQNMLRHFYEVAALLSESKKEKYLNLVLPLIIEPELMSREHQHP